MVWGVWELQYFENKLNTTVLEDQHLPGISLTDKLQSGMCDFGLDTARFMNQGFVPSPYQIVGQ